MIEQYESGGADDDMFEAMTREINRLIKVIRNDGAMCDIHRQFSAHVKDKCSACDR